MARLSEEAGRFLRDVPTLSRNAQAARGRLDSTSRTGWGMDEPLRGGTTRLARKAGQAPDTKRVERPGRGRMTRKIAVRETRDRAGPRLLEERTSKAQPRSTDPGDQRKQASPEVPCRQTRHSDHPSREIRKNASFQAPIRPERLTEFEVPIVRNLRPDRCALRGRAVDSLNLRGNGRNSSAGVDETVKRLRSSDPDETLKNRKRNSCKVNYLSYQNRNRNQPRAQEPKFRRI
jgi:hypothetical protein